MISRSTTHAASPIHFATHAKQPRLPQPSRLLRYVPPQATFYISSHSSPSARSLSHVVPHGLGTNFQLPQFLYLGLLYPPFTERKAIMSAPIHPRFIAVQAEVSALQNRLGRDPNGLAKPWTAERDAAMTHLMTHLLAEIADKIALLNWRFDREKEKHQSTQQQQVYTKDNILDTIASADFSSTESLQKLSWCLDTLAHTYIGIGTHCKYVYRLSPSISLLHLETGSEAEETRFLEHHMELDLYLNGKVELHRGASQSMLFPIAQLGRVECVPEAYFKNLLAQGKVGADMDWHDSGYVLVTRINERKAGEVWLLYDLTPIEDINGEASSIDEIDATAFYLPGNKMRRPALKIADSIDELRRGGEWKIGAWTKSFTDWCLGLKSELESVVRGFVLAIWNQAWLCVLIK